MLQTFQEPPAVLEIPIPRCVSRELHALANRIGPRTSAHVALVALAATQVKNVAGFSGGFHPDGSGYVEVIVRPTATYPLDTLRLQVENLSRRVDGAHPDTIMREWADTPTAERSVCKIVRDDVQAT